RNVTGVQTCALPISSRAPRKWSARDFFVYCSGFESLHSKKIRSTPINVKIRMYIFDCLRMYNFVYFLLGNCLTRNSLNELTILRSEERRVGKGLKYW